MKRFLNNRSIWIVAILIVTIASACKKYADPPPNFQSYGDSTDTRLNKVLIISIDGATGSQVQAIAPPNILSLEATGKYSYDVSNDQGTTDASSWVSMLTGVSLAKHGIADSSFAIGDNSGSGGNFEGVAPFYPNLYSYVLQYRSQYKTAFITPWTSLANYVGRSTDYPIVTTNDEVAKDSAVSLLKNVNSLGLLTVDFNEAELAGIVDSFSASDPNYKGAILKADGYVGEIMSALKARSNYSNENWLVIVTTNHGGSAINPQPGFIVYSNAAYKPEEVQKSGFSSVTFDGTPSYTYATMNTPNGIPLCDFNKDFSIQLDVLMPSPSRYPTFFGNKTQLNGGTTAGFSLILDGNGSTWTFNTTSGSKFQVATHTSITDGSWHTIAVTFNHTSRLVSTYTDGVFQKSGTAPAAFNFNGPDPLAIGNQPSAEGAGNGAHAQINIHNIEIFNTVLDTSKIANNICLQNITKHPSYSSLVGFWPCDDAQGSLMKNSINAGYSFSIQNSFSWISLISNAPCSAVIAAGGSDVSIVPFTTDVPANTLYWFGVGIPSSWGFDGVSWLNNF